MAQFSLLVPRRRQGAIFTNGGYAIASTIIEASSLDHARMIAAIDRLDSGFTFAEGYMFNDEHAAMILPARVGRLLLLPQAEEIQTRFKG
jgi:hypothetical protein